MAVEIFFPAVAKIFLLPENKGTRSNINYIHSGDFNSLNERYSDLFQSYRTGGSLNGFGNFLKQQKLNPSGFLDIIMEFYERMMEFEET